MHDPSTPGRRQSPAIGEQYSEVGYVDGRPARVVDIDWSHAHCAVCAWAPLLDS